MTLSSGTRLGPYEIVSHLGAGGMGEVYRAKDTRLGRDVAVKVLPEDFLEDDEGKARFAREARTLASLSHPNVAVLHSFEEVPGSSPSSTRHILVMELLEGTTLRDRLDSGPIAQRQVFDYALQIAKGLSAAHERGIVHRDLKPENLFVTKDGHLKILDFGLAKRTERETGDETSAPTESRHTEPGTVDGDGGLHVARAGARAPRRPPFRHLLVRGDPLRASRIRRAAVPRGPSPRPGTTCSRSSSRSTSSNPRRRRAFSRVRGSSGRPHAHRRHGRGIRTRAVRPGTRRGDAPTKTVRPASNTCRRPIGGNPWP